MARNKKYDIEFKKNIVELYQEGKAPTEIVREYGNERGFYQMEKNRYGYIHKKI